MTRKILILEDLETSRAALVKMVEECGSELKIYDFPDMAGALECAMENKIDLFLVDIVLKPKKPNDFSGITFARSIREHPGYASAEIVFITTLAGLEAEMLRSVHCFDYIEKPVTQKRVQKVVREALLKINGQARTDEMVFLRKDRVTYPVPVKKIIYVESRRRTLYVHTAKETIDVPNLSLKKFLEKIQTTDFLIPMKGIAVNVNHIHYVDKTNRFVKMHGTDTLIDIGLKMKEHFMQELFKYGDITQN